MTAVTPRLAALFDAVAPDIDVIREAITLGLALARDRVLVIDLRAFGDVNAHETLMLAAGGAAGGCGCNRTVRRRQDSTQGVGPSRLIACAARTRPFTVAWWKPAS
jgi:hypothetical protein